jgi:hypothetical protein
MYYIAGIYPLGIAKTKTSYGHRPPKQLKILKFGIHIVHSVRARIRLFRFVRGQP